MKRYFVINPYAGKTSPVDFVKQLAGENLPDGGYELYETKGTLDATEFVRSKCAEADGEKIFYACGGDGTLNEVANGAAGCPSATVACVPCGSGNDFVKYYGGKELFLTRDALVNGVKHSIDMIKIGDRYSINVTNFGFDAAVAQTMINVKRKFLIGGKNAYTTGIVRSLLKSMKTQCRVTVDGELINPDEGILLCTLSNGSYVGGSFNCAPRSKNDDGLIEVCLIKPLSRMRFFKLIGPYTEGKHLEDPNFNDCCIYRRGKVIEVEGGDGFVYCIDGEMASGAGFKAEAASGSVNFLVPPSALK